MSAFTDDCVRFIGEQPFEVIRLSQIDETGRIETVELTQANPCQNAYSVAKTFTMTAIGLLYDRGLIRLEEKVCDILRDELPDEGMDERWHTVTVEHALTHSAGLPVGFLDIDVKSSAEFTRDFLRYMLTYPLAYTPGEESRYSDGAYYLLSRIVEKKTGMGTDDYLWQEILFEMGFQEMAWSHCPMGHVIGATGLYIHSSDMVKLGKLYLDRGLYDGKRLLSTEWAELAMERSFAFDCDEHHRVYYKGGMCGQKLMIIPAQNRVVAMQAYGANSDVVMQYILNRG